MFYDSNDIQLSHETDKTTSEDTAKKYEAWGWHVQTINGNDADEIRKALKNANEVTDRPSIIIGKTIMGKGAVSGDGKSFERQCSTHGMPLSGAGADFAKSIQNLGGNPENPFQIFPEVKEYYAEVLDVKRKYAQARKGDQKNWEADNREAADKLKSWFDGKLPEIDYAGIEQKENSATRAASGAVLAYLAKNIENVIVASADLSNSDKTDGFLKNTKPFVKGDFSGAFLQAGVSELTMAAIANGMALHGGVIPVVGTFFVFSDYMKPAVRIAALQQLPVVYVWTHDAFRVGEDGPTHQPVEQEAQIRLMEQLKNHHGDPSMLVLRPADANETTVAWKMALENRKVPTALLLSRQGIKNLPVEGISEYEGALQAERGAYIVKEAKGKPDVILVANGSEVATLLDGAALLEENGKKVRVVSAISEGLFNQQPEAYQNEVLPRDGSVPIFGMTAGLPVTLKGLVGPRGEVFGLSHFGFSAPYNVLDEKFGFTGENVVKQVEALLSK